jgi:hypothetical protein
MQGLMILEYEYCLYYTDVVQGHGLLKIVEINSRLIIYCSVLIGTCTGSQHSYSGVYSMWSGQVSTKICSSYAWKDMFKMYIGGEKGQVNYFTATEESIATKLVLGSECSQYNIVFVEPFTLDDI